MLIIGSWNKTFGAAASQTHVKVYPIQERRKQYYNACGSVRGFPNLGLTTRDSLRVGPVMVPYGRKRLVIVIGKQLNVHISWKTNHNSEITQIWISFLHTYMSRNVTKRDSVFPMIKLLQDSDKVMYFYCEDVIIQSFGIFRNTFYNLFEWYVKFMYITSSLVSTNLETMPGNRSACLWNIATFDTGFYDPITLVYSGSPTVFFNFKLLVTHLKNTPT